MAYLAQKPPLAPPSNELRSRIPGWGVDLDPKDRPAVPKEQFKPDATGAHWDFPERQPARWPREKSPEHAFLTPVFGTACPPSGISGAIRRYAYRFSEGRTSHWLLLLMADRIDVMESRVGALLKGRPDSRLMETGVLSEFKRHGLRSRLGHHRADVKHQWIDVLLFAAPYLAVTAGALYFATRRTPARRILRDR
ncbi:MAG: hypothetical protein JWN85_5193 [Gammaproteobacteria bacterium]|nr:hypothetical protein [Gammaproteobacteria bacterium]